MRTDYYSVLQVEQSASDEDVRRAFRRLVLTHHPDRNGNNPHAAESTILLYEAYATLSDPSKRQAYDRKIGWPTGSGTPRKAVLVQRNDPLAPEAIRCARCSRCDDTLRHAEFFMVISLISFSKQSIEQPGVYCSGCRTVLGSKWLMLSMFCGWWSFAGLIWTPKAMIRNMAGGLRRGHSQRALLRHLASRLLWQEQYSDAARVVHRLSYLDPEYPKLGELTAKVHEGKRKPQKRSSFALHPRRLPAPVYVLPLAALPAVSIYASVLIGGVIEKSNSVDPRPTPIASATGDGPVSPAGASHALNGGTRATMPAKVERPKPQSRVNVSAFRGTGPADGSYAQTGSRDGKIDPGVTYHGYVSPVEATTADNPPIEEQPQSGLDPSSGRDSIPKVDLPVADRVSLAATESKPKIINAVVHAALRNPISIAPPADQRRLLAPAVNTQNNSASVPRPTVKAAYPAYAPVVPVRTPISPVYAPMAPVRAIVSPVRAPISPVRAAVSQVRATVSPTLATISPTRAVVPAARPIIAPTLATPSPIRAPASPPLRTVSPPRAAVSHGAGPARIDNRQSPASAPSTPSSRPDVRTLAPH